jgi:virulence-associated protein VapD
LSSLKEEQQAMKERMAIAKVPLGKKLLATGQRKGPLNKPYTDKQKLSALKMWCSTGSVVLAAEESGIQYAYLRALTQTQWWKDSVKEIRQEEDDVLDQDLSGLINTGVGIVKDRLKNGDWMWNSKENKFIRKALKATDALKVTTTLLDQRNVMRGKPTRITENVNVSDRLNKLAMEFEKFNQSRTIRADVHVVEVEDIKYNEELENGR